MMRLIASVVCLLAASGGAIAAAAPSAAGPFSVPSSAGPEPSRPLAGRGADNLAAFARAYGYVRFFYPGDAAAQADWTLVAIAGVRQVEDASSPRDLAKRLEAVLRPLAPEFRAWPTATLPPKAEPIPVGPGQRWRHEGVGLKVPSRYMSLRVPAEAGAASDLFTASLPGGVSVRLPLVTPKTGEISPYAVAQMPDKAALASYSAEDRATRLADIVIVWNVFQHFYPYFDVVGGDWLGQLPPALIGAAAAPDAVSFRPVLSGLLTALHDGHGSVVGPGPTQQMLPVAWEWIEGRLVVLAAAPGTGLAPGDVVTTLNGRDVKDLLAEKEALISGATPQWKRWRSSQALKQGPAGSKIALTGERSNGAPLSVTVQVVPNPEALKIRPAKPAPLSDLAPGVVYVDLDRIKDAELDAALPQLAAAKGVIFDMRGYPGNVTPRFLSHFRDEAIYSAEWNIPVALRPDRQAVTWKTARWRLPPSEPRLKGNAVFITDGRAISKAESFMGVVEGAKLGPIVGETTAGTNGDVNPLTLPGDYTLTWTGLRVIKQDGAPHHGVGVRPTVEVHRTVAGVRAGRDEQLEAALALAQGVSARM
ncbi:hypothetical protein E1H18_4969 [Caulobacter sp. RHG1]|nr:hypothetical protein [Caulobacter sp. RHG1]